MPISGSRFAGFKSTQKSIGHLLRDLGKTEASKARGAVRFTRNVTSLLRDALQLRGETPGLPRATFAERAAALKEGQLSYECRRFTDPDNGGVARRLRKDRKHLLHFLHVDELDATNNNQAERQLRPAITRNTTDCNRTGEGAKTRAILSTVLATCHQRNVAILYLLTNYSEVGEAGSRWTHPSSLALNAIQALPAETKPIFQPCRGTMGQYPIVLTDGSTQPFREAEM